MFAVGFSVIAFLAAVTSAQLANVISSCTAPNTVALTFVSVFLSFFKSPFNAYDSRMTVHISTSKEMGCFTMLMLVSLHFDLVSKSLILLTLRARRGHSFSVCS